MPAGFGFPVGGGGIVLLGDAAHVQAPTLTQGACLAFEDAATLGALMRSAVPGGNINLRLAEYTAGPAAAGGPDRPDVPPARPPLPGAGTAHRCRPGCRAEPVLPPLCSIGRTPTAFDWAPPGLNPRG